MEPEEYRRFSERLREGLAAAGGTVQWTANADGSFTIVALDVGFAGTADRMTTGGLTVQPCAP
jgi:hypothetical protein